jgi:DNA-binding NarL/FixJ family response regulator
VIRGEEVLVTVRSSWKELAISVASVSSLSYPGDAALAGLPSLYPPAPRGAPALVVVPAEAAGRDGNRFGLTPRDLEVLRFLSEGWTTAAIARELAYAESTIKKEVHVIVHRLGARNRTHAVALALRAALI